MCTTQQKKDRMNWTSGSWDIHKNVWFNITFTLCNYLYNIEVQVDTFETLLVIRLPDFLER